MKEKANSINGKLKLFLKATIIAALIIPAAASCNNSSKIADKPETGAANISEPLPDNDSVYTYVDIMPQFKGGDGAILQYIADNARYPEEAKKNNITGKVILKFVVGKDGSVSDVSVLKGTNHLLDSEAYRVVKTLPNFEKPGIKDGHPVAVQYVIPVTFALK